MNHENLTRRMFAIIAVILAIAIIGWWAVKVGPADDPPRTRVTPAAAIPSVPIERSSHRYGCVTDEPGQFIGRSGQTSVMLILDHQLCLGQSTTGTVMWTCSIDGHSVSGGDTFTADAATDMVHLAMDRGGSAKLWIVPPNFTIPAGVFHSAPCPLAADTTLEAGV